MRLQNLQPLRLMVFAVFLANPAIAQQPACGDDESVAGCASRRIREYREQMKTITDDANGSAVAEAAEENKELQGEAAGPNLGENLAQSAIRDFLPRFAGTLLTPTSVEDFPAVDVRFNAPLTNVSGRSRITGQGGLTLHPTALYEPLIDSIPQSIREASSKRLGEELEDGDDVTAYMSFNFEGPSIGRGFRPHGGLVDTLGLALRDAASNAPGVDGVVEQAYDAFIPSLTTASLEPTQRLRPECGEQWTAIHLGTLRMRCLRAEVRTAYEAVLLPLVQYEARRQQALSTALREAGFDRLSELVNNQPQANITVEYRNRVAVIGPNEWVGRGRVEWGFANINRLREHCDDEREKANPAAPRSENRSGAVTLDCLRSYTNSPATKRRLARSDRLWLAAEARYRPEYQVELADDSVNFSLGSGVGFGVSGGYGRYLGSAEADEADRDRIDLHLSYDHADGEDLRQSRFLAGLFYTLRISGNASGVVGLAWANKPEFVEGADRQLHANLGLSYKFNRGTKDKD